MTLTITPTVDTLVPQPRVRLVVTGTTSSPNPVGLGSTVQLFRNDSDGQRRRVIVESGAVLSGGSWTGFDYHCPFNAAVTYTAVVDGKTATPVSITLPSAVSWLLHPNNPSLSTQVSAINEIGDRTKASTAVLSYAFGATYPISLWEGTRHSVSGQIVVRLASRNEQQAVDDLLADSGPVLLNLADTDQGSAWWDEGWAWVQPGDITYSNPAGSIYYPYRHLTFPYTVVDTPAGAEVPIWTYGLLAAQEPTYGDVSADYKNYSDLWTNTVSTSGSGTGMLAPDVEPGYFATVNLTPATTPGYYTTDTPPTDSGTSTEYDGGSF